MQAIDNHYLKGIKPHKKTEPMHDLKTNFDKILPITPVPIHPTDSTRYFSLFFEIEVITSF